MADSKLSAKEAALIAQARAALVKKPQGQADAAVVKPPVPAPAQPNTQAARPAAVPAAPAAAVPPRAPAATPVTTPIDPAARIAALFAAERAETERKRARHKKLYLWIPAGIAAAAGLWAIIWMLFKL